MYASYGGQTLDPESTASRPDPPGALRIECAAMFLAAAIFGALAAGVPAAAAASQAPATQGVAFPASQSEPAARDQQETENGWSLIWDDRPSLRWGELFQMDVRARFQNDFQWSPAFDTGYNFLFALKRVGVRGHLGPALTYALDRELNVPKPWRDAYVNIRTSPALEVRAGQFKLPFGLDQNTPLTSLDFVYRSRLGALLSPGRDPGVMVHGRTPDDRWTYFAGGFTHDGRTARIVTDALRVQGGPTFAARLLARPFAPASTPWRTLQVGAATTVSDVPEGLPGLRPQPPVGGGLPLPQTPVKGRRVRLGFEAQWLPGPWSFKGEYARVTTEREDQAADGGDLSPLETTAWFASAVVIITGESAEAGADTPRRPVFQGGPGAIELGVRVEGLTFGSTATGGLPSLDPGSDRVPEIGDLVWTFGVTWYWNRWIKVQANVMHDRLTNELSGPAERWGQVIRLQYAF